MCGNLRSHNLIEKPVAPDKVSGTRLDLPHKFTAQNIRVLGTRPLPGPIRGSARRT